MAKQKIKVMVCDDHALFRQGLISLLETEPDLTIVGEAVNGKEAVEMAKEKKPDIILMDIRMPIMDGISATREIKKNIPDVKILMLTVFEDELHIFNSIQAGASGYFLKAKPIDDLINIIRKTLSGDAPLSPEVAGSLIKELHKRNFSAVNSYNITEKELEVLSEVILGKTNKEISQELNIAIQTVKNHLSSMYRKFEVNNRTKLVHKAAETGVISDSEYSAALWTKEKE
ncbi:MAG: response regulator transcription factor [Elusimicrobia bacterium]|nr:response regulator transcription factor [Elusimicrobiota bacterium]